MEYANIIGLSDLGCKFWQCTAGHQRGDIEGHSNILVLAPNAEKAEVILFEHIKGMFPSAIILGSNIQLASFAKESHDSET